MSHVAPSHPSIGQETFTSTAPGPGIWLFLQWQHGLTVLDVMVDFSHHAPTWDAAEIEVLAPPRPLTVLPDADPVVLYRTRVALQDAPGSRRCASLVLPRTLSPETARSCFYRVHACRID